MALRPSSIRPLHLLRLSTPARNTIITTRHASTAQQPGQTVEGASSKSPSKAQPKILSDSPPQQGQESEEVRKHNEEMDKRADRAAEKVKDEDLEKDKVGKGFWTGEQSGGGGGVSGGT